MFWYHGGTNGWGWLVMSVGTLLFWAVLVAAGVLFFRALNRGPGDLRHSGARNTPEQLLAERFARGEIDEDEYRRRLSVLRGESQKP
jgi:putative membrane protein